MSEQPAFELIIGPADDYYYFKDEIFERISRNPDFEYDFIYFLPVKRAVRYFKEQLIELSGQGALPSPPVYTFYEFVVEFYRSFPDARKVISPSMRLFLVEEILKKEGAALRFFSPGSAKRRGLVRKVEELLTELREYGYSSHQLTQNVDEDDMRTHDFALLIDEFEKLLGSRLIDEAGAIQRVIERLDENSWRKYFPHIKMIYLNGYGLFTRPMYRFFEKIRNICSSKIKLDYLPEHPLLFEHVEPAYTELQTLTPTLIQDRKPHSWEKYLFRRETPDQPLQLDDKDILLQPAMNRNEEIAFIANYIKGLHLYLNVPLHQIGITFPSLEHYAPLIHGIFSDYGVPYNLSTGFQLSQSPLIRSFLLLLEVPESRYEVKKLIQLITSPFYAPSKKDESASADGVQLIAKELRLTHFQGNWEENLDKYLDHLQKRLSEGTAEDNFDERRIQDKLQKLEKTKPQLKRLLAHLQELEPGQQVKEFRNRYLTLLRDFGFLDWYEKSHSEISAQEKEKEYRAFNRFVKLLDQFSWIVTNLHGERKLALKEFHQYLNLLVSQATYNLREWANYGVQIMPRLEILSNTPQVLIFGGMVEGDFPRPFTQDVFFNDEEREQLGLAATEDLLAQDRFMFYQILKSSAKRIVFTYPRFEKESARVPSNFLNTLADQTIVRWRQQLPSPQFLRNPRKLLPQIAENIPAKIRKTDRLSLQRWKELNSDNEEIINSLPFWLHRVRINYTKRARGAFNEYEGFLSRQRRIVDLLQQQFAEHPFSITRLETYAYCPIKFFFKYILRIDEEEEIVPELTPIEQGQMVHQTLFRFYTKLREQNHHHQPWEHTKLLKEIAEEAFADFPFKGILFELEKERYLGSTNNPGIWDDFLRKEEEYIPNLRFYPAFFEIAFGPAGRKAEQDPISVKEPITLQIAGKTVQITGKIDRIDLNDRGEAILLDYKTGRAETKAADIQKGVALQLPIYAVVLPQLLQEHKPGENIRPVMAANYQVRDVNNVQQKPVILDKNAGLDITARRQAQLPNKSIIDESGHRLTFQEILELAKEHLFTHINGIREGSFRHTEYPDEPECRFYCEFRRMCRKDVAKLLEIREGMRTD